MIKDEDISVVIQGPVGPDLIENVRSVRAKLPRAEIILSTWVGAKVPEDLGADHVLMSEDPGFMPFHQKGAPNNTNRQLVSTLAGLRKATRPYALKMRTDFQMTGLGFVEAFDKFPHRDAAYSAFKRRIVIPHYASRVPDSRRPYPFHPSDLTQFGLLEDLINLYDVPLATEQEMTWAHRENKNNCKNTADPNVISQYAPEQHFFIKCLQKNGAPIACEHFSDNTTANIEMAKKYLANNYTIIHIGQFGLLPLKATLLAATEQDTDTCYSARYFEIEYQRHCDPKHALSAANKVLRFLTRDRKTYEQMIRHGSGALRQASRLFDSFHRLIADSLTFLFYLVRSIFNLK